MSRIDRTLTRWLGATIVVFLAALFSISAWATSPAAFTTVNDAVDVTLSDPGPHCLNGNPGVNCNIYTGKQYVWMNGGPLAAQLPAGSYFFAVLSPGGQASPNDGGSNQANGPLANLSDDFDTYLNRTFSVDGAGNITYTGHSGETPHDFSGNEIRLMPYQDTPNPGGVYILAICSLAHGYPVAPNDCKYDAFKVQTSTTPEPPPGKPLTVTKDAAGSYIDTYAWTITKAVDKTIVKQIGGSATFNYTVKVSHDDGTISGVKVTGTISVFNPNVDDSNNTVPVDITGVTDQLSDGTVCTVDNGGAQTLTAAKTDFTYSCDLPGLPNGKLDNTVTVTWPEQILTNASDLAAGFADFSFEDIQFDATLKDNCVNVTDSYAGTLGTVCVGDANPTTFTYSRTIPVPQFDCTSYDNTAKFTTNTSGTTGSAGQTVTVCGPAKTGALTIGFWKTTNGQGLIKTYCQNPALANYLKGLGGGSGPFSNAPTTSCTDLATYVQGILTAASATDMNKMLRAQMLATALDVWFSGPGYTATTINSIKPPSKFLSNNNLGSFKMDTTAVCPMVDNTTTGSATCKNNTPSTDAVASGAVPSSPMKMQAILDFAATTPSPYSGLALNVWYGGDRTKQEILKNIFDQFNNQMAFGSF